jgi:hypothetical protein
MPSRRLHTGRQQLLALPFRNMSSFEPSRRSHTGNELRLALLSRNMSNPPSRYQLPARKLSSLRYSHRERKRYGFPSCCFVCLLLLCCWCWCDCCAVVAVMLLVCCCWSCVELFCLLCTVEVWCCFCFFFSHTGRSSPSSKHGGERYCEVGRCVVETISMPLLQLPLTKRMAASVTCEVGRCLF